MKKIAIVALAALLFTGQSLFACTIFAVGKDASTDGSTMTSHTCDSTSDDLRVWIIPSMEAGTERDIVVNGRAGADYSQFPEVKNYGDNGLVVGTYLMEAPSNQYLHAMYSFINDKGLAMGESTCSYDRNSEQGQKLRSVFSRDEGVIDCYMLQDLALENCSSAREAVEFMGNIINEYGWNGACECINICDGEEAWVVEFYGANVWCAARVPDDAVFVAANRARINHVEQDDPENWIYSPNLFSYALDNGLWDGKGEFRPCVIYCPNPTRTYSTRREWRAMMLLDPSLNLDPEEKNPDENWPLFVVPKEKVSVDTIHKLSSDYYQGTAYDTTHTLAAGPFGNPLYPSHVERAINCFRCTYIQISNIKSWYPDPVKCLAYFGWGAPDSTYLTPVFASTLELPSQFGIGVRNEPYNEESGWWVASLVQNTAATNYVNAIQTIHEVREPKLQNEYKLTNAVQEVAAAMVNAGNTDGAIELLTIYQNEMADIWHETWKDLAKELISTYMHTNINMRTSAVTPWWQENVVDKGLK